MIDVLPTIFELTGVPLPTIVQGRSLAPLLLGKKMDVRPVILDEFRVDEATGQMVGNIEMIDGRWGASLEIGPVAKDSDASHGRHAYPAGGRWGAVHPFFPRTSRMLLYDLWNDPFAATAVGDDHPELVQKYQTSLMEHWRIHQALATQFVEAGSQPLDQETLKSLQTLGYTR
jgi:arylsulfatase A-like enzyme